MIINKKYEYSLRNDSEINNYIFTYLKIEKLEKYITFYENSKMVQKVDFYRAFVLYREGEYMQILIWTLLKI